MLFADKLGMPKKIKDLNSDKGKDSKEPKDSKWSNPLKNDNKQAKQIRKRRKKKTQVLRLRSLK